MITLGKMPYNKANSLGQISATFVCAMNSTSLTLLQFAGDLRRYVAKGFFRPQ